MMKLEISPMRVTEIKLSPNSSKPDGEHENTFKLSGSISLNPQKSNFATLIADVELTSYGRYEIQLTAEFIIKFEREVAEDEAERLIEKANTEVKVLPYISAYITAFVTLSGYQSPGIPVVLFDD